MIAESVWVLSAVSAEMVTNHEAFKRIKRKPLCDENRSGGRSELLELVWKSNFKTC